MMMMMMIKMEVMIVSHVLSYWITEYIIIFHHTNHILYLILRMTTRGRVPNWRSYSGVKDIDRGERRGSERKKGKEREGGVDAGLGKPLRSPMTHPHRLIAQPTSTRSTYITYINPNSAQLNSTIIIAYDACKYTDFDFLHSSKRAAGSCI